MALEEPSYDHLKLRDATGKWYRRGEIVGYPLVNIQKAIENGHL